MSKQDDDQRLDCDEVLKSLRSFIEFSLQHDEKTWSEWIKSTVKEHKGRCWEIKQCNTPDCPAYENENGRCWLIAGTLCGGKVQGKFAQKYNTCIECEVYQDAVFTDKETEFREHILVLVHSLIVKQLALREALEQVKILKGLIPICMVCKKIRDDEGYWDKLESYISKYTDAEFSHGICPDCFEEKYPDIYENVKKKKPDIVKKRSR